MIISDTMENRYKNGKIYSIRSHQTEQIYIGSTCVPLCKRIYLHKAGYKHYLKHNKNYISSFEIIKYDDCYIELIEEYPCDNKMELTRKEGEHIRANNCVNVCLKNKPNKPLSLEKVILYREKARIKYALLGL